MVTDIVEKVDAAIEAARCPNREGPFGGYDYGHNTDFYGPAPEGGRYVIRDFRDPASPGWGKWVHQTHNREEHEAAFERMTREHIAKAAITTLLKAMEEPSEGMIYDAIDAGESGASLCDTVWRSMLAKFREERGL